MKYKTIIIKIPEYHPDNILKLEWETGFLIKIQQNENLVILQANENGILSLAKHLIALANPEVPENTHIHFDSLNSLEAGSSEFIIEKIN